VALHQHCFRKAADVQLVLVIGGHTAVRDPVQGRRSGGPFFAKVAADDRVNVPAAQHVLLDEGLNVDLVQPTRPAVPLVEVLREPMEDRPALIVHHVGPLLLGDDLGGTEHTSLRNVTRWCNRVRLSSLRERDRARAVLREPAPERVARASCSGPAKICCGHVVINKMKII
jgi:hypothetical protein